MPASPLMITYFASPSGLRPQGRMLLAERNHLLELLLRGPDPREATEPSWLNEAFASLERYH